MKALRTYFLLMSLSVLGWQIHAQSLVDVYKGTSLPTAQGWNELRFDNSMVWEQASKDLLVAPSELSAVAGAALKLKVNEAVDQYNKPLYSQLGWYKTHTGFSSAIGFTVEFRAKVENSDGTFTVSGVGGGKGFRLELSNSLLTEHANVVDTVRVLSTADNTDDFHIYRVAVTPDGKVYVWRDGVKLGELPLQTFKLDNIFYDGGFEKGGTPEEHGWTYTEDGTPGTLTVSSDPNYVHTGKYGLFVDKGIHKNEYFPVKPGSVYDVSVWGKTISYPSGAWRDFNGWYDPISDKSAYFVGDANNMNWKYYERLGVEGGADYMRFIMETMANSSNNNNQMAYDDIYYAERIPDNRIPAGAVNLFPNGDFEDPCYHYFPEGDPRNDTCIVNPNNYRYSADAYYGGKDDNDPSWFSACNGIGYTAEHNAAPFWHPFWGARVRTQYQRQACNSESGGHWARGKYSLRYFNCGGYNVPYGSDFSQASSGDDRGGNSDIKTVPINLEVNTTYTFLFSYHFAKWGGDNLTVVVKNGNTEIFRKNINNSAYPDWVNPVIEFTTDADNHALQILTERTSGGWNGGTPGVVYFDDFNLFKGKLLPIDDTHLFFGKQTGVKGAEVDVDYIKVDNTGSYDPAGALVGTQVYAKKAAPLMTVWGEALPQAAPVPAILDEYPRPQLKRDNWTNLNGIWNITRKTLDGFGVYNATEPYRQEILVPFPVESALSGIMDADYTNQNKTYSYMRKVTIAKPTNGSRVLLNFGAVDWESYVFVNGTQVAHHKGGFDPFSADITDALNASGNQEIVVQAFDPTRGGQPAGKQNTAPGGDQYSPSSGIWQTVWTETVNPAHITSLELTPVNNTALKVKVDAANAAGATATVSVLDGATVVATADVAVGAETSINISSPKLWSPQSPFLYNLKVDLKKDGATTDEVTSYFGMRKLEIKKLRNKPYIYLNGNVTFNYASLDHGYFPDGLYTPASYDAIRFDLKKLKELGFNAVRKFEKIEPAVWYHIADSLGLLVWQDIPAAYETTPISELSTANARKANFLREAAAMTAAIRNFPSVAGWIGFNDGWGRYDYNHVLNTVNLFRSLNDGRLVAPESGGDNYELGDVVSTTSVPLPSLYPNAYNERASACFITGSYSYVINGHVWNTSSSSDIKNDSIYAARLNEFSTASKNLTFNGMAGLAMVQTSDVENEVNGLMTYDRKVYKAGAQSDSILKATTDFMQTKIIAPILKTGAQGGELWKYVIYAPIGSGTPPADWYSNVNSDANNWSEGLSGFGSNMGWFVPNTPWAGDNREIYLRKMVNIPVLNAGDQLQFTIAYDENYEFYINGVLASSNTGWTTSYVPVTITPEAQAAIKYGADNLFAIHVIQNGGGSAIDLGVTAKNASYPITYEPTVPVPVWKDIATAQDWLNIKNDLNGFYRLTADINLFNASNYQPIGSSDTPFKGYIDGRGHTVICPEINTSTTDRVGLFGYADGAYFVNLRFTEASITGQAHTGILMGGGKGVTVEHVVFDDDGIYQNEVTGLDHVGVVAGTLFAGKVSTIKNVYAVNAKVSTPGQQAGGLVGVINDTRIINSYFTGTISVTRSNYLTGDSWDASGIASRTEGGHNSFTGVMSLASKINSGSGNEWLSYNGGGFLVIDSATCFTRNDMALDPLVNPNRGGQFARATDSMKRPDADFKSAALFEAAGWDFTNVWIIPAGGGYPVFNPKYVGIPKVVNNTVNNLRVYSDGGNIVMIATAPTAAWIYNLQGVLVDRSDFTGNHSVALPRGIYIVKSVANGIVSAVKVINK